ncbi:unnamed protein product [Caretta caretta]
MGSKAAAALELELELELELGGKSFLNSGRNYYGKAMVQIRVRRWPCYRHS